MFEEIEPKKNHKALFTFFGVFALLAAVVGVAVAAYTWTFVGNNNVVGTGNISMSYLETSDVVNITNALPLEDSAGKSLSGSGQVFNFAVTTTASGAPGDINYTISMVKQDATSGFTQLTNDQVKLYLEAYDDDAEEYVQVMAPTYASKILGDTCSNTSYFTEATCESNGGTWSTSGNTTGTFTFDSGKTSYLTHSHQTVTDPIATKYRLKMWVAYTTDASSWNNSTKLEYKIKLNVNGNLVA